MKSRVALVLAAVAAALAWPGPGAADDAEAPVLRFDPFRRPDLSGRTIGAEASRSDPAGADWSPVLRGTLVAGDESLADLGGVVLELGEETRGYRLVEVRHWEAVFERNGATLVLTIDPPEAP